MAEGEWEQDAENWVLWARKPGFDAYWYFRDNFFDAVLPTAGRLTLELGCGEGRVSRDLAARGHRVVGLDSSMGLVRSAAEAGSDGGARYLVCDSALLPFRDDAFDIVVAYNVLQVVADMPATIAEVSRVLMPDGAFCFCIAHPVTDLGRFLSDEDDAPYAMRSPYFETRRADESVERDGLTMTFRGWTYTLEDYALALERAGFVIQTIREPRPDPAAERYQRWQRVPLFMNV